MTTSGDTPERRGDQPSAASLSARTVQDAVQDALVATASESDSVRAAAASAAAAVVGAYSPPIPLARSFRWLDTPRRQLKRKLDNALGEAPHDAMGVLISLISDCDLRAYDTRRASKRWGSAYYFLGLPAAVLATIAGAAGLATAAGRIPAAIIALVAAGLATAATFLNSNENKQQNSKLSAAWQELADDVRLTVVKYSVSKDPLTQEHLLRDVISFNKRKSALLRGDLASMPERPPSPN
jgi:hypothetical protein